MKQTQNTIKTKKIGRGHYEFNHNGQRFEIVNHDDLIGYTWQCRHMDSLTATETKHSKSYLMSELKDWLLEDFFTGKEYWDVKIDENGLF